MATPKTVARDPATGFVSLVGGGLSTTTTLKDYVICAIASRLSMFAGEWYLDTREGVPYFKIVSTRPDMALLRSLYRRAVLAVPGVSDVTNVQLSFDGRTRGLSVVISCTLTDGDVITNVPYLVPWIVTNSGAGAQA
jgi:hypothetical protein